MKRYGRIEVTTALFKFQYGATNIVSFHDEYLKSNPFKFQYGATNIRLIIT